MCTAINSKLCTTQTGIYHLPLRLPTKLAELRDHSNLMEEVWVSTSETKNQPWLDNPDVRAGIRAMIKLDPMH